MTAPLRPTPPSALPGISPSRGEIGSVAGDALPSATREAVGGGAPEGRDGGGPSPTAGCRLPTAATVSPVLLRLSRKAGFRLQAHSLAVNGLPAVNVARPGKWGNPFTIRQAIEAGYIKRASEPLASQFLVECFEDWLLDRPDHMWTGPAGDEARRSILSTLDDLRGKNIACWCAPGAPCHGDVLLELASRLVCEEVKS